MANCKNCGSRVDYKEIKIDNRGTLIIYVCKKCGLKEKAYARGKVTSDDWAKYGFY